MIRFKFMAIAIMAAITTSGFSQNRAEMLLGKWKVQQLTAEYPATMPAAEKMKSEMGIDKFAERFKSFPFVFEKDSTLSVMGKDGQWALEKDQLHIRFILMQNEELMATIISLEPDQLKFSVIDHDIKEFFTLTKIK